MLSSFDREPAGAETSVAGQNYLSATSGQKHVNQSYRVHRHRASVAHTASPEVPGEPVLGLNHSDAHGALVGDGDKVAIGAEA
jgi:hypothetical protein